MPGSRIALGIAYDGAAFSGWQRQADALTVQGALEAALAEIAAAPVQLAAAGRTDAGVHANGQVAHFDAPQERPLRAWVRGTNTHLPPTVRVCWARTVEPTFHARFSATARRYVYLFADESHRQPLLEQRVWFGPRLAESAMHRAAQLLLGEQDFSAVRAAGCQSQTPMRCVHQVQVRRHGFLVSLDITANAFLLHMVRNIASALQRIGRGSADAAWLEALLASRDRTQLGPTAPPGALTLVDVRYPAGVPQPTGLPPALLTSLLHLDQL